MVLILRANHAFFRLIENYQMTKELIIFSPVFFCLHTCRYAQLKQMSCAMEEEYEARLLNSQRQNSGSTNPEDFVSPAPIFKKVKRFSVLREGNNESTEDDLPLSSFKGQSKTSRKPLSDESMTKKMKQVGLVSGHMVWLFVFQIKDQNPHTDGLSVLYLRMTNKPTAARQTKPQYVTCRQILSVPITMTQTSQFKRNMIIPYL